MLCEFYIHNTNMKYKLQIMLYSSSYKMKSILLEVQVYTSMVLILIT